MIEKGDKSPGSANVSGSGSKTEHKTQSSVNVNVNGSGTDSEYKRPRFVGRGANLSRNGHKSQRYVNGNVVSSVPLAFVNGNVSDITI